jgi:hypothetical protein
MNAPWNRIFFYLLGGGLLLTWLAPPEGLFRLLFIAGLILAFAYLDALLSRRASSSTGGKVVSLGAFKAKQKSRTEGSGIGRERRGLRPVYSSVFRSDVESLLEVLRAEGMNPMMVTQNRGGAKNLPFYMVMLQEKDAAQAKPIIDLYAIPSAKKPS